MLPTEGRRPPRTGWRKSTTTRPASTLARVALVLSLACGLGTAPGARSAEPSLYQALGGQAGIDSLADVYVERLASAPATARSFEGSNLRRIKQHLASQICQLAGGPCQYDGDTMAVVHANLGISEAEFFAGVASLRALLRERGIPLGTTNRLLALLAPMKRDIVDVRIDPPAPAGGVAATRGNPHAATRR
jgi:hemoglobin